MLRSLFLKTPLQLQPLALLVEIGFALRIIPVLFAILQLGGTSGGADGTSICTVLAGDSISMPFKIASSVVLRIKPTSGALTSADYVQVSVS